MPVRVEVAGLVCGVTNLVQRVSGEANVPFHVLVSMVRCATPQMVSACARLKMAVSALQGGLDLTVVCRAMTPSGDQTVLRLVSVGTMEFVIRYIEMASQAFWSRELGKMITENKMY